MAINVLGLDRHGHLWYVFNEGMPEVVVKTELEWCRLFRDMESMVGGMI